MMKTSRICPDGLAVLFAFAILSVVVRAGAVKEHRLPVKYEKKSAQGFAVCQDFAFLCNDTAYCRIHDLKNTADKKADCIKLRPNGGWMDGDDLI